MTERTLAGRRPWGMAVFLLVTGFVGLYGAFSLVLDEFTKASNPHAVLHCDVNPFISCSDVMASWQGHLFGFPNPVIGVMGFVAPIAVGVMLLSGGVIRARGFWTAFNAGVFLAWVFIMWLFTQTVWAIGALCPWCMLVWSMTIPMFWILALWSLRHGYLPFGPRVARVADIVWPYGWAIVLANYLFIALVIVVHFPNLLPTLF